MSVSELREQIAALDEQIAAERAAIREHRVKLKELRQLRNLKLYLVEKAEKQGEGSGE